MRDWAVCTIGTTARLEIDRFEKACAFEPYGSECRLIPTIRRDLPAAKTATPGRWPHVRIGNLLSEDFPCTFCIVANDRTLNWFGSKKGEGIEYFVLLLSLLLVIVIKGSGALSLDFWMTR